MYTYMYVFIYVQYSTVTSQGKNVYLFTGPVANVQIRNRGAKG